MIPIVEKSDYRDLFNVGTFLSILQLVTFVRYYVPLSQDYRFCGIKNVEQKLC